MSTAFAITPATVADVPGITNTFLQAFASERLNEMLPPTPEVRAWLERGYENFVRGEAGRHQSRFFVLRGEDGAYLLRHLGLGHVLGGRLTLELTGCWPRQKGKRWLVTRCTVSSTRKTADSSRGTSATLRWWPVWTGRSWVDSSPQWRTITGKSWARRATSVSAPTLPWLDVLAGLLIVDTPSPRVHCHIRKPPRQGACSKDAGAGQGDGRRSRLPVISGRDQAGCDLV